MGSDFFLVILHHQLSSTDPTITMSQKIKIGIFFGGPSREREISFKGGKTAYENLDKAIFEPILIFVDSFGNFIQVEKELLYEASIRDFFPSRNLNRGYSVYVESLGELNETQLYKLIHKIGKQVKPTELSALIDFAFIIMHGPHAEDGSIQGLLEWYGVPYLGPGVVGSAIGIDKYLQNELLSLANGQQKRTIKINKEIWQNGDKRQIFAETMERIGFPLVIKAPHQGSSIGIAILKEKSVDKFIRAVQQCFFETTILKRDWEKQTDRQKKNIAQKIANLDEGIGFPLLVNNEIIYHPADLVEQLDIILTTEQAVDLSSANGEDYVIFEEFTEGQEFSCGVIQDDNGRAIALPPTEIYSESGTFDFKSKYIANTTRKRIPVDTSFENLEKIHESLLKTFRRLGFNVVTRTDGFLTPDGRVLLHDPNTLPGMSPASLIFKQMGEVGLNITQSINYFIRQSVRERIRSGKNTTKFRNLLSRIDAALITTQTIDKKGVAVMFEEEESQFTAAKAMFNKLAASPKYKPFGVLLKTDGEMVALPVNMMMKDTTDDILALIATEKHPFLAKCITDAANITKRFTGAAFNFEARTWTAADLAANVTYIYDVETDKITEL